MGTGKHSPFTRALLEHIETPQINVEGMLKQVRRKVIEYTDGQQIPWQSSSFTGEFYFAKQQKELVEKELPDTLVTHATGHESGHEVELEYWRSVKDSDSIALYESYLKKYPSGLYSEIAAIKVLALKNKNTHVNDVTTKANTLDLQPFLTLCETHFSAEGLISGQEESATKCYQDVLIKDPGNQEALNGIRNIETHYAKSIDSLIGKGSFSEANYFLVSLKKLKFDKQLVKKYKELIEETIKSQARDENLIAADSADAGSEITVEWTGPEPQLERDYITIVEPDAKQSEYDNYIYMKTETEPKMLRMPDLPGLYELRYVSRSTKKVLARKTINVRKVEVTMQGPSIAHAGATIDVAWSNATNTKNYITVVAVGADNSVYNDYVYTRNPEGKGDLIVPEIPGNYEIRYVTSQSKLVLASLQLSIKPISATVKADKTVGIDEVVNVSWTGPANKGDYLTIAEKKTKGKKYISFKYAKKTGSGEPIPVELKTPSEACDCEVRYISKKGQIWAQESITVE